MTDRTLSERAVLDIISGDRWADFFDGSEEQEQVKGAIIEAIRVPPVADRLGKSEPKRL